ncbi:MAG: hypothetical protein ACREEM_07110 [Blastocatellia bacterium]
MSRDVAYDPLANEVMVTIIGARRALHGAMPAGLADIVLAALTFEPETPKELEAAIARYDTSVIENGFLKHLKTGVNETPWDAGVLIIDLPARLIAAATEPALYQPSTHAFVFYCLNPPPDWPRASQASEEEMKPIHYRLSGDWLFAESLKDWRETAERRRRERAANPPFDARPVLFGKVTEFIVRECLAARDAGIRKSLAGIHAKWLMTPRDDLRGRTPREVLVEKCKFIDYDMDSRAYQSWCTGQCPPPLKRGSAAYRFAGFGMQSNVVYYNLVRHLLKSFWFAVEIGLANWSVEEEVNCLEMEKKKWLKKTDKYGRSPKWILEQERLRKPITTSVEEFEEDPDSCLTVDPAFGPIFWFPDDSKMGSENNWIFSLHPTREDWEAEQLMWKEIFSEVARRKAQREAETEWAHGLTIFDDRQATTKKS